MKAAPNGTIRLALMNLEHDGGPEVEPGVLPNEWRTAFEEVLKPLQADWIGLTELTYSQTRPDATDEEKAAAARRWKAARRTLSMRGFRARMGQGRNPTGMLVRESTFTVGPQHHLDRVFRTPPTNVVLGLSEAPGVPIITAAFHSSFCNPTLREAETYELTALVDKVKAHRANPQPRALCWLFGDANELPVPAGEKVPDIDWSSPEITDLVHRRHRALKLPDGSWKSCTFLDEVMHDCGMHDPARYAARHLDQVDALNATAGFADSAVGQGGPRRIDRGLMDGWSVQAVTEVAVIDMSGLSDHHLLVVDLSRGKLIDAAHGAFSPLAPWELVF
ncbi:endonuclease/exonuclease/phosphatase family protein [Streptomyces sp. NPDC004546]|uniref:endonuclease/exonuclease/phosphatase family protein n=1 Tax=Streptomyces sp. NPDC004546 TaxID=3154282 RepID=UPI0033B75F31